MNPRSLVFDILGRVEEGAFADLALDGTLERHPGLDPRDRRLVTELVYGVLRYRARLDFALQHCCRKPLAKVEPAVLRLLRLGCYQLLLLDRIPARAAVYETVELARQRGLQRAAGFINGILRALGRQRETLPWPDPAQAPLAYLEHYLSLPAWLARRWLERFGAGEAMALAQAMLQPPPCSVRANTLKMTRAALLAALTSAGCEAEATRFAPEGVQVLAGTRRHLPGEQEGLFQLQDEASMLIAHLLAPRAGQRILDACAAPGGKTTHIAALTGNSADILALDLHPRRVKLVTAGASRLGCHGIAAQAWDLSEPPAFLEPGSFDRVLVDAPCSGLGVLRRNPEIRWRRQPQDLAELAARQTMILDNVASLVRPGGRLLYSLCTPTAEETDEVVAAFLDRHPEFAREDLRIAAPPAWQPLFDAQGALRTLPHRHDGMDAFFAVAFRRVTGGS